jgi:predicted small lipoprotein YifL
VIRAVAVLLLVATALAACGRVGPVRPPGPPDQITYPRTYPGS